METVITLFKPANENCTSEQEMQSQIITYEEFRELLMSSKLTSDLFFGLKFGTRQFAMDWLRCVLKPDQLALLDLDRLTVEEKVFYDPNFQQYRVDMLYRVPRKPSVDGEPDTTVPPELKREFTFLILVEQKTNPDKDVLIQLLEYLGKVYRRYERNPDGKYVNVVPIILYNGTKPFYEDYIEFKDYISQPTLPGVSPLNFGVIVVNYEKLGLAGIPQVTNNPEFNIVSKSMHAVLSPDGNREGLAIVEEINRNFAGEDRRRLLRETIMYVLRSAHRITKQGIIAMMEAARKAKEQPEERSLWDQFVQDIMNEQGPKIREEGKQEGQSSGMVLGVMGMVVDELQLQFGRVPKTIQAKLSKIHDYQRMKSLFREVSRCRTLREFSKLL